MRLSTVLLGVDGSWALAQLLLSLPESASTYQALGPAMGVGGREVLVGGGCVGAGPVGGGWVGAGPVGVGVVRMILAGRLTMKGIKMRRTAPSGPTWVGSGDVDGLWA